MGGAMTAASGRQVGFEEHGPHMGGRMATPEMMGAGMSGGTMGGGMTSGSTMMGPGWRHSDGTYGMVFTFTTG